MIKEACVESFYEARKAETLGADRIELCENLHVDGTTPSLGTILTCKKHLKIPVMVMVRPRGGDFVYSAEELEIMRHDIEICKRIGVHGIVIGLLNKEGFIDLENTEKLVALARPLKITFHKAIDISYDIFEAFNSLRTIGVDRILTSGRAPSAEEGREIINELVQKSRGKIKIMAAGNITNENLHSVSQIIKTDEFHGRRIVGSLY